MDDYNTEEAAQRLFSDIDCKEIFRKLLKQRGVDEEVVFSFKYEILNVPNEWRLIKDETIGDRKKRHEKLAHKIKLLAGEITRDVDAMRIRLFDENSIFTDSPLGGMTSKPTVSAFLFDLAGHVEKLPISQYREQYEKLRPDRISVKEPSGLVQYTSARVFEIFNRISSHDYGKNISTATLVNVLLNLSDDKKINNGNINFIRKKYFKIKQYDTDK